MKKHLLFAFLFLSLTFVSAAQQRFEFGIEGGPINCYYSFKETSNHLESVPCVNGYGGINCRYNSRKRLFGELGILKAEYTKGFKVKEELGYSTSNHDEVLLFPVRLGYLMSLSKKLTVASTIGITTGIKTLNQDRSYGSSIGSSNSNSFQYNYRFRQMGKDVYTMLNGGVAVEWRFLKRIKFSTGINYFGGLSRISVADVQYRVNADPPQTGEWIGKGSFMAISFGFKYMLR
jgi:hypothetical protein